VIEQDKPLAPTAFTPQESSTSTEPALEQRPGWLIPAMAGVIVTAVAVFFVLPLWVADNGTVAMAPHQQSPLPRMACG